MSTNGYGQQNGDIYATIVISQSEALYGTTRTLNLQDGRTVPVNIPPSAHNGQELRMDGQGLRSTTGAPGALILTISIPTAENFGSQPYPLAGDNFPTNVILPPPPPPPIVPSYPAPNQGGGYTSYPAQGQGNVIGNSYPSQPVSGPGATFTSGKPVQASKRPPIATIVLAVLALLVIVGGVLYYFTSYQPQKQNAQATATANVQAQNTFTASTAQAIVTSTAQVEASATANATPLGMYQAITATSPGLLNDPLSAPSTYNWDTNTNCGFKGGTYHAIENQTGFFYGCTANATNFTHFLYQVKMTFLQGIYGGIFFRSDPNNSKYYLLRFDNTNGDYDLYVYSNKAASSAKTLLEGTSSSFKTGLQQTNVIAVLAKDTTISLYVNSTYVNSVQDSTYSSGNIGVFAEDNKETSEVSFEQAQVWNA